MYNLASIAAAVFITALFFSSMGVSGPISLSHLAGTLLLFGIAWAAFWLSMRHWVPRMVIWTMAAMAVLMTNALCWAHHGLGK